MSPEWMRWREVFSRADALPNSKEIIAELQKRLKAAVMGHNRGLPGEPFDDARYDLCADILLGILEPEVTLAAQADEYEETMLAEAIIKGLDTPEAG